MAGRRPRRWATVALLGAALCTGPLGTGAAAAGLPEAAGGVRPGPAILYADPPRAPQLENTGPWAAQPILVSGASAYRDGEFLYQDFLFDDRGAAPEAPTPGDEAVVEAPEASLGTLSGGSHGPLPSHRRNLRWGDTPAAGKANRLRISATNVRSVAIDAARARVGCDAVLDVTSDGPLRVDLRGCGLPATVPPGRTVKRCTSRRVVTYRVPRRARGRRVLSVRVQVGLRPARTARRHVLRVSLRGLPAGRVRVRYTLRLAGGRTVTEVRRYRTCARRGAKPRAASAPTATKADRSCGIVDRPFTDGGARVTIRKGALRCSTARGVLRRYWSRRPDAFSRTVRLRYRGIRWRCRPTTDDFPYRWRCRGGGPELSRFVVTARE